MAERYAITGATTATAATADNSIASVWNPSSTRTIKIAELHVFKTAAGAADIAKIRRITARGTATTTKTPAIQNEHDRGIAPPSGFVLDVAYSVQPTFDTGDLYAAVVPGAIGAGFMWVFNDPIQIYGGAGISICTGSGLAFPISWVTAVVLE